MNRRFPYSIIITPLLIIGILIGSFFIPTSWIHYWIELSGIWGPVVLIFFTLVTAIFAPLSGTPLLFLGYTLFGEVAVWYISLGGWLSFSTNYWIARKWGRPLIIRMVGEDSLEKVDEFAQDYGLMTLFILRFLAGGFHDFVSYAMGLTPIAFRAYILISTIGFIPGTLLWFYLARNIENPLVFVASTWVIIGLLTGGYLIWKSIGIKIIHFPKLIANLLHLLRK